MKCDKCKNDFSNIVWEKNENYLGIDRHHNPPEEIYRFLKEKWNGEFCILCRNCHKELHKKITIILQKYSLKKYNSDYWLMKFMTIKKIEESKKEIYLFTKGWINEDNGNKNTDTITK